MKFQNPKNICKTILFILLLISTANAQKIDSSIRRIVFLGNSITWQANYVNDVIAYLTVRYPNRKFDFINVGLPSETVSGLSETGHAGGAFPRPDLHERLKRVLDQTKPDLVLACYGINDGIYLPFDATRFQKFKEGINWLHEEIVTRGLQIMHITPPVFDELRGGDAGYAAVIDRYAKWLLGLRSSLKWKVIDVHFPMKKYLDAHRQVDARFNLDGFALSSDGVHPSELGHWIMAKAILIYLGCDEVASDQGAEQSLSKYKNGSKILKLVSERQNMLRDSWLTATGHKRPGMPMGLPLDEALKKSDETALKINALVGEGQQ